MADPKADPKNKPEGDPARAKAAAEPLKEVGKNEVDLEAARPAVDERLEKRSEANEEGHAKNMEAIEKAHEKNEGKPDPKLGRADNACTPIIDPKTGAKHWPAPGVAGVMSNK